MNRSTLTHNCRGLAAAFSAALVLGTAGLMQENAAAAPKLGDISGKPWSCMTGFKQVNKSERYFNCASVPIRCPKGYQFFKPKYNQATQRVEYACARPEPARPDRPRPFRQ